MIGKYVWRESMGARLGGTRLVTSVEQIPRLRFHFGACLPKRQCRQGQATFPAYLMRGREWHVLPPLSHNGSHIIVRVRETGESDSISSSSISTSSCSTLPSG